MEDYLLKELNSLLKTKENFLKSRNLNPYRIFKISKNSSIKSIEKAYQNMSEKTEDIEYCYDYVLFRKTVEEKNQKDNSDASIYTMNDPEIRKKIFIKDDIQIDKFLDIEKKDTMKLLEEYKSENNKSINSHCHEKFISPKTKKFNIKKFNDFFEDNCLVEDEPTTEIEEFNKDNYSFGMPIKYYDGIILEDYDKRDKKYLISGGNQLKVKKSREPPELQDTPEAFDKKTKERKKNIDIPRRNYADAEAEMLEFKKMNSSKEKNNNRNYIYKNF